MPRSPPFPPRQKPAIDVRDVSRKAVPFLRPLEWISTALRTFRERPLPASYSDEVKPTIDLFGAHRLDEVQFALVLGPIAGLEVTHTRVPEGRTRFYLSMELFHTDLVGGNQELIPGRVIEQTDGTFPFAALADSKLLAPSLAAANDVFSMTVRNFFVPPGGFAAGRVSVGAWAARMQLRVLWVELALGEYLPGNSY